MKRKHLIYITRDYVNSNDLSIKKLPLDTVEFSCLRWQGFYGFLKQQPETQIIREVLQFMERQRMNMSNQFLATDLVAMMNFYRSQKLMEACLGGSVEERFKKEFGQISRSSAASSELQNHGRFIRYKNNKSSGRRYWPGIGFFDMHSSEQTEYPSLGVFLQVDPGCESRDRILNQMIEITSDKSSGWQGFDLSNPSGYPNISYKKSLQAFLSQEDQVASIQEFFGDCIEECLRLKKNYPGLLWD